jgi:hypothetical protein
MNSDERKSLSKCVGDAGNTIGIVVANIDDLIPEINEHEAIRRLIEPAWKELKPRFSDLQEAILSPTDEQMKFLEARGLDGEQGKLKVAVFEQYNNDFRKAWGIFRDFWGIVNNSTQEAMDMFRWPVRDILRRLLKIIDRILDSLGLMPGADAAKEFKGIIEDYL